MKFNVGVAADLLVGKALLFGFVACATCISTPAVASPANKAPTSTASSIAGWILYQKHSLIGSFNIYITKNAVKVDGRNPGWSIIAKAPKWNAIIYSKTDKTICEMPYTVWSKQGFAYSDAPPKGPGKDVKPLNFYRWYHI